MNIIKNIKKIKLKLSILGNRSWVVRPVYKFYRICLSIMMLIFKFFKILFLPVYIVKLYRTGKKFNLYKFIFFFLKNQEQGYYLNLFEKDIFLDVNKAFRKFDFKPFALFGTLVGIVNEGGVLFNDDDIDFGLFDKDFRSINPEILFKNYDFKLHQNGFYQFTMKTFPYLHFDIFSIKEDKKYYYVLDYSMGIKCKYYYPKEFLTEFKYIKLKCGIDVYVPVKGKEINEFTYGKYTKKSKKTDAFKGTGYRNILFDNH